MNTTGRGDGGDGGPENRGRNITKFGDAPAYRYLDYNLDPDGRPVELSWNQLGTRLRGVAARLQQVTTPGDRVAILAPQGVDYVGGFFAAVAAATIAVPLFAPELPGHAERLDAVLGDAEPTVVLTTTQAAQSVQEFLHKLPRRRRPRVVAIDAVPDSVGTTFVPPAARGADDIAYLQYTSGSTRAPRRCRDHPPRGLHERAADDSVGGAGLERAQCQLAACPTAWRPPRSSPPTAWRRPRCSSPPSPATARPPRSISTETRWAPGTRSGWRRMPPTRSSRSPAGGWPEASGRPSSIRRPTPSYPTGRSAKSGCTATTSAAATGAAHAKPTWHSTTRCSRGCTAAATPRARRPAPAGSAPSPSGPPAAGKADPAPVVAAIRAAVSRRHALPVADVRLVAAGTIPRTTSGKPARRACRAEYLGQKLCSSAGNAPLATS